MPSVPTTAILRELDRVSDAAYEETVQSLASAGFKDPRALVQACLAGEDAAAVPPAAAEVVRTGCESVGLAVESLSERIGRLERSGVVSLELDQELPFPAVGIALQRTEASVGASEERQRSLSRERD